MGYGTNNLRLDHDDFNHSRRALYYYFYALSRHSGGARSEWDRSHNYAKRCHKPAISIGNTGGGLLSNTYSLNDILSVLSPAPSGENNKQVQNQYDGLGRLTSSCAISSTVSGNVACGQSTGSSNGILTTTAYTSGAGYQTVTSSRGPSNQQQRSVTVDGAGRTTQKVTPEGGTWTYT